MKCVSYTHRVPVYVFLFLKKGVIYLDPAQPQQ